MTYPSPLLPLFRNETEESKLELENIKRCFWINLFNFKILQKLLEI